LGEELDGEFGGMAVFWDCRCAEDGVKRDVGGLQR
jgi:hypothetical protein